MIGWGNMARIAAGIFVVVAATFLIRQEVRKRYTDEVADTYTDPQLAFEETKRALQMISNTFGKAKKEASKMQMLNEAEKKIQSKKEGDKINI
jgi:lipase chaperone LimK